MERTGVDLHILEWAVPERTFADNALRAVSRGHARRRNDEMGVANSAALEKAILDLSPDYVLVMDGQRLTEKTKAHCRKEGVRLAMWAYDSAVNFPWIAEASVDYDVVFTFEPEDVEALSSRTQALYLPLAYDPSIYHPSPDVRGKRFDVCFVGAIRKNYPERTEYLSTLVRALGKGRVEIWSEATPWYSPFRVQDLKITGFGRHGKVVRRPSSHSDNNLLYNQSSIALNVHNKQSQRALNPRTFETLGSGSLLMTDRGLEGVQGFKEGRDYAVYEGVKDLVEKTRLYLGDEELLNRVASSGHSIAEKGHTYEHRAKEIMSHLKAL